MNARAPDSAEDAFEQGFELGAIRIDPVAGDASGPGGREKLDPKVMGVLLLLARHAGQVVSREQLLSKVWPGAVVSDDALSRCVYELRRQLSQAGDDDRYKAMFETLPKRGYRLNASVTPLTQSPGDRASQRAYRRLFAAAAVVLAALIGWFAIGQRALRVADEGHSATAATNSIAVLPFVDMSPGQDQGWLSDGITEEILDRLAAIPNLRVIARTSSFTFRNVRADIPQIAAKLSVSHVLEGSVRRSGDHVRITAQLVEASSNSHLWSKTYDRALGDIFAVQGEIAGSVAAALEVTLARSSAARSTPVNAEAYERMLRGRFFQSRRARGDIERAIKYYEEAISIDPSYAPGWVALSGAYGIMSWSGGSSARLWETRQGEAARKAVELDPDLAAAHARLGQWYFDVGDRSRAQEHFRKASKLDPDEFAGFDDIPPVPTLDIDYELAGARRKLANDPLSAALHDTLGTLLVTAGRFDEALSEYRQALELSPDYEWPIEFDVANILLLQHRYDEAQRAIAHLPEGEERDHGLARLHGAMGRQTEAAAAIRRLSTNSQGVDQFRLAETYAFTGHDDEAFASLQRARDALEREQSAVPERIWHFQQDMLLSPFLRPLRADARWNSLMVPPG